MPFFAPVPREVDRFTPPARHGRQNLTLDWWPVGTGPSCSAKTTRTGAWCSRATRIFTAARPTLRRRGGRPRGRPAGRLRQAPAVHRRSRVYRERKVPYWNKFLQGYYDASGISSDSFDQAVRVNVGGDVALPTKCATRDPPADLGQDIHLLHGLQHARPGRRRAEQRATKLRQAISIAIDQKSTSRYSRTAAASPRAPPPGIFGYEGGEAGMNGVVYDWVDGKPRRKPVAVAKRLMVEAGYPNGRDEKSGEPLVVYLDTTGGGMGEKSGSTG